MAVTGGRTQTTTTDYFGTGTNRFGIEFVEIGEPGNPNDPVAQFMPLRPEGVGAVNYRFRMGKYETAKGIVRDANASGGLLIVHNNDESVAAPWGDKKPATNMNFYEIARFVNWLNLVRGYPPAYKFTESGDWQLWGMDEAWSADRLNRYRHRDAFYFVPNVDEWHKAAFWDPVSRRYWLYPYGSDRRPVPVPGGTEPGTAVSRQPVEQGPADVDNAGGLSPYGVMGMAGNLWDYLETARYVENDSVMEWLLVRGGRWFQNPGQAGTTDEARPWQGSNDSTTFRVAAKPLQDGDVDGDGVSDQEERIAGTDPQDGGDWPRLTASIRGGQIELGFWTVSAPRYGYIDSFRYYALERTTGSLAEEWRPVTGYERVPGEGQEVVYREAAATEGMRCFRLRIWIEAKLLPAQPVHGEQSIEEFGQGAYAFSIEFIAVRDEGNQHDFAAKPYPMGGVSYPYRIAKYETSEETVNHANVLGGLGIRLPLLGPRRPATTMTFLEQLRFVNWLNTSKGHTAAYNVDSTGAWQLWSREEAWSEGTPNLFRHKDAVYFLPSADEWYKAAYFNGEGYYSYPTGANQEPLPVSNGQWGGSVVYRQPADAVPAEVDDAGGLSHYGAMAMGGNVAERIETTVDGSNNRTDKSLQERGGAWAANATDLRGIAGVSGRPPAGASATAGFRVAARYVSASQVP